MTTFADFHTSQFGFITIPNSSELTVSSSGRACGDANPLLHSSVGSRAVGATSASRRQDPAAANEIAELSETDFDLQLTGFDAAEIEEFLSPLLDEAALDAAPPAPSIATSVRGDLWMCGKHRVLCGDGTSAADVTRLYGSSVPVLMVTDPPYGVAYDPQWREAAGLGKQRQTGTVQNDDRVDWREAFELFQGDVAYGALSSVLLRRVEVPLALG